ncbi:MAG: peptidoglycan-binding protein [Microcoleus sp. PH2017_22_RUC_O_B]|nr:peptidoglycan-binding protein [Microcoleus sp. PH2017_21_RUC_O_A]MCC3530582.1 peptidoglycan-binding protein [Microcoleus sp. PH2017_21_RUC_O_A]MCC3542970.1 peptidoglycan-binding protein [Microcoleus sp. PH2017_22_RUC_O_B]
MSRNLTASWNKARKVPSLLLGWSLYGLLALGAIASTPARGQLPTSEPGNNNSPIAQTAQTGAIVRPALKIGSRGSDVTELQAALKLLGFYNGEVDGIFSQSTAKAVSQFQEAAGIAPDGIVGQDTWNRLFPAAVGAIENPIAPTATTPENTEISPQPQPTNFPVLRRRMRGPAVRELQERLRAKGFLRASADGVFGRETEAAVKAAQRRYQLPADGIVGRATWEALLR